MVFLQILWINPKLKIIILPFLSYFIQTGADLIGINCRFAPDEALQTISLMKHALDKEGLKPYLMMQPVCYHAPDGGSRGFIDLPEIPFGELWFLPFHFVVACLFHPHWEIVPHFAYPPRPLPPLVALYIFYIISQSMPEYLYPRSKGILPIQESMLYSPVPSIAITQIRAAR